MIQFYLFKFIWEFFLTSFEINYIYVYYKKYLSFNFNKKEYN